MPWRAVSPVPPAPQPYAAPSPASQGPIALVPQAAHPSFPVFGDGLDDWCQTVKLPSSIAICSDRDLRALVLERQHAFDDARARLIPDRRKALLADQNSWVRSYAGACGLSQEAPPSLPLAPAIKGCMVDGGRARIAYLRDYGASGATTSATTAPTANATGANGAMYRCRDPKTNFIYTRPQPCAEGDIILSGPGRPPAAEVLPIPSAPARNLVDVLGPDPGDRTCLDFGGPNASPVGSPGWLKCKADDDAQDAQAQAVWDRWTPDQRAVFLKYLHTNIAVDPRVKDWTPRGVASRADWVVAIKYTEIAVCGAPKPNTSCPSEAAPQPGAPEKKTSIGDCNSDWQQCADNSDLANHYHDWVSAQVSCASAVTDHLQYGSPKWPWLSFSTFRKGTDYVTRVIAILIEPDAQLQNMYGAMVHAEVLCRYDLRTMHVVDIDAGQPGLLRRFE